MSQARGGIPSETEGRIGELAVQGRHFAGEGNDCLGRGRRRDKQGNPARAHKARGTDIIEVKCDYCLKLRPEEKTLELDDGKRICVLCLAGEVER